MIQGVAGSGKTSVALHRIAYLLYHDRKNLKSSNILILSPNGVFSDYISHILPELGEENIQEMSFDLFAYRELKDVVPDCEDRYDMIERNLVQPKERGRYWEKQSPDFLNQMEGYLMELEDSLMDIREITRSKHPGSCFCFIPGFWRFRYCPGWMQCGNMWLMIMKLLPDGI